MKFVSIVFYLCLTFTTYVCSKVPNFLLIIADDSTYSDLGLYGGQAYTPHLDRLASEGLKFNHCMQASAMCSPTRHNLLTGLYPVKSGAYPNHTMAYDWVKSVAHYLQSVNYTTHLVGKKHIAPAAVFPFEYGASSGNNVAKFSEVLESSKKTEKPFLFIAASYQPHAPWDKGDVSVYPLEKLCLPLNWVDTTETREAYSRYLAEVTYFDAEVGELLEKLDQSSLKQDTLVIVLSEQGSSFPFAKWTCYDAGLRSACIMRWPNVIARGSVSDALIEYVDFVPTLLEIAAVERPKVLDGESFLSVIKGEKLTHKNYAYGLQTSSGIGGGPDFYAIRTISDGRYRLIRNLTPEAIFQNTTTRAPLFKTWKEKANEGDREAARKVEMYQKRPFIEFYDSIKDPWNQHNLAFDSQYSEKIKTMQERLDLWMQEQGDEGQATEMRARTRMPKGKLNRKEAEK